jgi:putative hydrolase of the HAD superfamily
MKIPKKPERIVFDLDDTIYSYKEPNDFANRKLLEFISNQTSIEIKELSEAFESSRRIVKNRLGKTGASHSRLVYLNEMLRVLQINPRPSFLLRAEQVYWSNYFQKMELREGFLEFIEAARHTKVHLVLVSDLTLQIQLKKLIALNLDSAFDCIYVSEEIGGDKETGYPGELLTSSLEHKNCTWFIGDRISDFIVKEHGNYFFNFGDDKSLRGDNVFQNPDYFKLKKWLESLFLG